MLPVAEVGTAELERSNECSSALEVLESRSEAPKPAEDTSRLASGRSIESAPLLPIKDNQHLWTDDETVANVADPPGTHAEPPIPQIKRPTHACRAVTKFDKANSCHPHGSMYS